MNSSDEEPFLGLIKLLKGVALHRLNSIDEAENCFRDCIQLKDCRGSSDYDHVFAFASFELASILLNKSTKSADEGKSLLQSIRDSYKNYDFENRLIIRIHSTLRLLE